MAQKKQAKRSDGRYQANVCIGTDDNGKRLFKTVYGRTKTELENNKADVKAALNKGIYADDKGLTVGEYAIKWLETFKGSGNVSNSTYYGYSNIIRNHIETIKQIKLMKLTKSDLQDCINKKNGHYDIQRRIKLTINQILESAIEDGLVFKNVSRGIELPVKPKKRKRALTDFEIKAIEKADLTIKQRLFIQLLLDTGMRRGEILALSRKDITDTQIHVTNSLEFINNTSNLKETKTAAGDRYIDILSTLKPVLDSYLKDLKTFYLFTNKSGAPMSKTSYRSFWQGIYLKVNTAAGGKHIYKKDEESDSKDEKSTKGKLTIEIDAIKGLTPHIFRHNFATILYYAGVDILEAQRILGHSDAKTTIEIYTHLDKQKSKSKNKIEEYLNPSKTGWLTFD